MSSLNLPSVHSLFSNEGSGQESVSVQKDDCSYNYGDFDKQKIKQKIIDDFVLNNIPTDPKRFQFFSPPAVTRPLQPILINPSRTMSQCHRAGCDAFELDMATNAVSLTSSSSLLSLNSFDNYDYEVDPLEDIPEGTLKRQKTQTGPEYYTIFEDVICDNFA